MTPAAYIPSARADLSLWLRPWDDRPWTSLYNRWIRPQPRKQINLAPIQLFCSDDAMIRVFSFLSAADLAAASLVCTQWYELSQDPKLWRQLCIAAFNQCDATTNEKLVRTTYGNSWKRMFVERPHIRTEGVYVSRNTYFRLGVAQFEVKNPVHLVVYYRYFKFFKDGTVLMRTSPDPVRKVWPSVAQMPAAVSRRDTRLRGRWKIQGSHVFVACEYAGTLRSELRCRLLLRSRPPGQNNRLDIIQIFTYDRSDGSKVSLDDPASEDQQQEKILSEKGCNTLVFVPSQQVNSHMINLSKDEMDVWIPG
jgi:F-box protein 9